MTGSPWPVIARHPHADASGSSGISMTPVPVHRLQQYQLARVQLSDTAVWNWSTAPAATY